MPILPMGFYSGDAGQIPRSRAHVYLARLHNTRATDTRATDGWEGQESVTPNNGGYKPRGIMIRDEGFDSAIASVPLVADRGVLDVRSDVIYVHLMRNSTHRDARRASWLHQAPQDSCHTPSRRAASPAVSMGMAIP